MFGLQTQLTSNFSLPKNFLYLCFRKIITYFKRWSTDDQAIYFSTCPTICRSAGYDKLLFHDRYTEHGVELISYLLHGEEIRLRN
jgi:hypothetical protein